MLDEGALQRMQFFTIGETFDGRDLVAFMRDSETEAGIDAPPVDQDRARAALAVIAAFFEPVSCNRSRKASSNVTRGSTSSA